MFISLFNWTFAFRMRVLLFSDGFRAAWEIKSYID